MSSKKEKGKNWSTTEISFLKRFFEGKKADLDPSNTSISKERKDRMWNEIAVGVSVHGKVDIRTPKQVQEKLKKIRIGDPEKTDHPWVHFITPVLDKSLEKDKSKVKRLEMSSGESSMTRKRKKKKKRSKQKSQESSMSESSCPPSAPSLPTSQESLPRSPIITKRPPTVHFTQANYEIQEEIIDVSGADDNNSQRHTQDILNEIGENVTKAANLLLEEEKSSSQEKEKVLSVERRALITFFRGLGKLCSRVTTDLIYGVDGSNEL